MSSHGSGAHHHDGEYTTTGGVKILLPLIILISLAVGAFYLLAVPVAHKAEHHAGQAAESHAAPAAHGEGH